MTHSILAQPGLCAQDDINDVTTIIERVCEEGSDPFVQDLARSQALLLHLIENKYASAR